MSTPATTATVITPPVQTQTPSTTPPPAATTPASPLPSTSPASAPSSSNEPAAVVTPPAAPNPSEPVTPPVGAPVVTPPAAAPAATTVEEEYELEVADNSPLSQQDLEAIVKYAEKYNLSKEDAQAMVAAQESQYTRGHSEVQTRQTQELEQRRQKLVTHPEFSGEKAADSWNSVSLAVQAFGTPELVAALQDPNKRGYDLDLAIMLKNIGDQLKPEGTPAGKGVAVSAQKTAQDAEEARLRRNYPSLFEKEK